MSIENSEVELKAVRRIGQHLASSVDLRQVLRTILEEISRLLADVQETQIYLYEAGRLNFAEAQKANETETSAPSGVRPRGLSYSVARLGKMIAVPDMSTHPLFTETNQTGSIVGMPLKIGARVVGIMTVCRQPVNEFTQAEIDLLQDLANFTAVAIENARLRNLIEQQAYLDPLTGLHNRHSLEERLEGEIERNQTANAEEGAPEAQRTFSLFMMDLDGFRSINENYGRLAGDYVLKEIAHAINQALRKTDFLARYGGDEIALVLRDTNREVAQHVANRVQEFVAKTRFNLPNIQQHSLTISIGIALFPENGADIHDLVAAAEQALVASKRDPQQKINFATPAPATRSPDSPDSSEPNPAV